ncbi:hypothetical protein SAMN04488090_4678 [Siphonobacter aquaeclarae]|uniref:Uncharacterized protein n=2 Tax=Siphonobacter aquaeclarae TaxID=563176 RepID=A0A1G9XNY1_9BACT|nr:hypothetical protein SAMN04488090_4678 [Siphonobacter aquaeclarae]
MFSSISRFAFNVLKLPAGTWILGIMGVFVCLFTGLALLDPVSTSFSVTAQTERISVNILDDNGSRINLYEATIYDKGTEPIYQGFNGSLKLQRGTSVQIERIAYGPAILTFTTASGTTTGTLFNESGKFVRHTGRYLQVFLENLRAKADSGFTTVVPIDGEVSIGRSIDFETFRESTALFRSGQISLVGSSRFADSFDAGTIQLFLGDQIVFEKQQNNAFGFVTINEEPGMQASYRVAANQATVLKSGPQIEGSGYAIRATKLDRLLKSPTYQFASLFFGSLVIITTLITFLVDIIPNKNLLRLLRK